MPLAGATCDFSNDQTDYKTGLESAAVSVSGNREPPLQQAASKQRPHVGQEVRNEERRKCNMESAAQSTIKDPDRHRGRHEGINEGKRPEAQERLTDCLNSYGWQKAYTNDLGYASWQHGA